MLNYLSWFICLLATAALLGCNKLTSIPKISPTAALHGYADDLVTQHKSQIQGHSPPMQTVGSPPSYMTHFFTTDSRMLTSTVPEGGIATYERNLAITKNWNQMYCTEPLQRLMRENGIVMASAQIIDSARGEKHSVATCVTSQTKSPPPASNSSSPDTGSYSLSQICKAGFSVVYGRDTALMSAVASGDQVQVKYSRPTDGALKSYRCKLHGGLILTWDDSIAGARWYGSEPGDSRLEFHINADRLLIRDMLGDTVSKEKSFLPKEIAD